MKKLMQIPIGLFSLVSLIVFINRPVFSQTIGMQSYTYRNSFTKDAAATLDTLKLLGIKDIELSYLLMNDPHQIRELMDKRGISCSSYGTSYKELITDPVKVGEIAKNLGAKFVMVASIPHKPPFKIEDAQKAVDDFNKAGKLLKQEFGITFCYHNHGYEFTPYKDGSLFDYIVQKTNPKNVSFELDVLWAYIPGTEPDHLINKYGKRFKLIHLKDFRKGAERDPSGKTSTNNDVALGTGQLDIPSIMRAAKMAGIKHYYIEDESPDYYKQVAQSITYLKSLKY